MYSCALKKCNIIMFVCILNLPTFILVGIYFIKLKYKYFERLSHVTGILSLNNGQNTSLVDFQIKEG